MQKVHKFIKLDCHCIFRLGRKFKKSIAPSLLSKYSASLMQELRDLAKLIIQSLSFLIWREGVLMVLTTLEC